jgi:hypothetical protein
MITLLSTIAGLATFIGVFAFLSRFAVLAKDKSQLSYYVSQSGDLQRHDQESV